MSEVLKKTPERATLTRDETHVKSTPEQSTDRVHTTSVVSNGVELPWPLFSERVAPDQASKQLEVPTFKQEIDLRRDSVVSNMSYPTAETARRFSVF